MEKKSGQEQPEKQEAAPEQQIDSQTKPPEKKSEEQTEDIIQLPLAEGLKKDEDPKDKVALGEGGTKDSKDQKEPAAVPEDAKNRMLKKRSNKERDEAVQNKNPEQ